MKHKGNNCDYIDERNKFFYDSFNRLLASCDSVNFVNRLSLADGSVMFAPSELMKRIAASPCYRCWISVDRAIAVVAQMERGFVFPDTTSKNRLRLYNYIHRRYIEEQALHPEQGMKTIVFDIVNSTAPESFVSPASIPKYIIAYRNAHRKVNKLLKRRNEQADQEHIVVDVISDDCHIHVDATPVGVAVGIVEPISTDDKDNLHDGACKPDSSDSKHICHTVNGVCHGRKASPSHSIPIDIRNHTKRINRRHTNVRYLRCQQRIDWSDSVLIQ